MKAVIEFDLDDERFEFEQMMNANKYYLVISETLSELRQRYKYKNETTISIEEIRGFIHNLLEEYNLLDEF